MNKNATSKREISALIYQLDKAGQKLQIFDCIGHASGDVNNQLLKCWVSTEFEEYFDVLNNLYNGRTSKLLNLNLPIFVDVYIDDVLHLKLEQVAITADLNINESRDYAYKLKKKYYVLLDRGPTYRKSKTAKVAYDESFEYANFEKLFNAVEYQMRGRIKLFNKIIYTPM